jgi:hypothetical protein
MTDMPANDDLVRQLVSFAKSYAQSKASVLDSMPKHVCDVVNLWLADMLTAAEAGNANVGNRLAGKIGSRLKYEMTCQLQRQRRDRNQRGQHFRD